MSKTLVLITLSSFSLLRLLAQASLGNASVSGKYQFIYAVWKRGDAGTLTGSLQLDGKGAFTLEGRWQAGPDISRSVTAQGSYRVLADGTGQISNPLDTLMPPL